MKLGKFVVLPQKKNIIKINCKFLTDIEASFFFSFLHFQSLKADFFVQRIE